MTKALTVRERVETLSLSIDSQLVDYLLTPGFARDDFRNPVARQIMADWWYNAGDELRAKWLREYPGSINDR